MNTNSPTSGGQPSSVLKLGGAAVVAAAAANVVLGLIAKGIDVPLLVRGDAVPIPAFAISTIVSGTIGVVMAWIFAKKGIPARTFLVISVALTVLSMVGPLGADASTATKVVLALGHVVAAVIIIPVLMKSLNA